MRKDTPEYLRNEKYCACVNWVWTPEMGNYDEDGHHPGCMRCDPSTCEDRQDCNQGRACPSVFGWQHREDEGQQAYVKDWGENHSITAKRDAVFLAISVVVIILGLAVLIFWR